MHYNKQTYTHSRNGAPRSTRVSSEFHALRRELFRISTRDPLRLTARSSNCECSCSCIISPCLFPSLPPPAHTRAFRRARHKMRPRAAITFHLSMHRDVFTSNAIFQFIYFVTAELSLARDYPHDSTSTRLLPNLAPCDLHA